jgi:FkbM family methyltransferase
MAYPVPTAEENEHVRAMGEILAVLAAPMRIKHPFVPLEVELHPVFGARVAYLIAVGDYELTDLELIERHVKRGDRVLEIGGGAGLTAALSARRSRRPVIVAEADARLLPIVARQVAINGGKAEMLHGVVMARATRKTASFYLDVDVWKSATVPGKARRKVTAPVLGFDRLLAEHRPTVVVVDIEGGERELFGRELTHRPRIILVEIHTPHLGETEAARVVQSICDRGYRFVDQMGWTYVFERR